MWSVRELASLSLSDTRRLPFGCCEGQARESMGQPPGALPPESGSTSGRHRCCRPVSICDALLLMTSTLSEGVLSYSPLDL